MKTSVRALALFLSLLLTLAVFASCGGTPDDTGSGTEPGKETGEPADPVKLTDFTIPAKADTYVQNGSSSEDTSGVNYITDTEIMIKTNGSSSKMTRYGYVWFDISRLKDDHAFTSVEFAIMLSARQKDAGNPENIRLEIYACDEKADPEGVTFKNQPAAKDLIVARDDITSNNVEYTFPVTDFIRKAIGSGKDLIAFRLVEATPGTPIHVHLYSSETGANGPKLKVSYTMVDDTKFVTENDQYSDDPDAGTGLDTLLAGQTAKASVRIVASEDVYITGGESDNGASASKNFGKAELLDFKAMSSGSTNLHRKIYLKFDISKYAAEDFSRASLLLDCYSCQTSTELAAIKVYSSDPDSWDEMSITYKNAPAGKKLVATGAGTKGTVSIDVTDAIAALLADGENTACFVLEGDNSHPLRLTFRSKDAKEGFGPTLVLDGEGLSFTTDLNYSGKNPWDAAMTYVNEWTERWADIRKNVGTSTAFKVADSTKEYTKSVGAASASNTNGASTKYTNYQTRTVSSLNGFTATDESDAYDSYGGMTGGKTYKATGYFYVTFDGGRWIAVDPLGNPFFRTAVVTISTGSANQKNAILKKYGNVSAWAAGATERLKELGFNSMGGWSDLSNLSKVTEPLAGTQILYMMRDYCNSQGLNASTGGSTTLVGNIIPVFDPKFVASAEKSASAIAAYKNMPGIFGWMSDNELPDSTTMLDSALMLDPTDARFAYTYATAWTFLYKRLGDKEDVTASDVTDELRREFRAMVYERYLKICSEAIDKYDPNHMYLGSRFLSGCYKDPYVMKVAGKWCDVISFNYYSAWTPDSELISNIQKWADTPFIVTEWYAKGMDACTAESRLTNKSGAGWTVKTQEERGLFYQNFALKLLECKHCVGFDWFKYHDNDPDDKGADSSNTNSNKGMYNTAFEEYTDLTDAMQELNLCKYALIGFFDGRNK